MKYILTMATALVLLIGCAQNKNAEISENTTSEETMTFDSARAKKLGADAYGMKMYILAFLKEGPNRSQGAAEAAELQKAHLANITRMAEEGKLVLAGPFMDEGPVRGIYVFNVATVEEAEALTNTDPAIKAGRLVMELKPWYGSAALGEINDIHKQISELDI